MEFLYLHTNCTQYYFEYSSQEYIEKYEQSTSLGEEEIGAEFRIALEIIAGCATKMLIRTTDGDVTVPLDFGQAIDPLDAEAIKAFMITALNHGTNPSTAGNHATLLQVLSRFGRKTQTPDQPFSLKMLADPEQRQAADRWVGMFRKAPDIGSGYQQNIIGAVKAFRAGHAQAREEDDPLDAQAIKAFMITAVNHGTNPSTAGSHATLLQGLSRFGRKSQTPDQPFSLTMLADPEQQQAADRWLRMF
ncbi:hypothetical protein ACCS93_38035, partial [Rhizobium ruizarguesonis]